MRISDWSSDVCSSDLVPAPRFLEIAFEPGSRHRLRAIVSNSHNACPLAQRKLCRPEALALRAEAVDRPPADETRAEWAAQGAALWSPAPALRAERSHRYSRYAARARSKWPDSWVRTLIPPGPPVEVCT